MRFVTVKNEFFSLCDFDKELLEKKNRRPHLLVVSLRYRGRFYDFAVPLRSNIAPNTPKSQYFPLPPRPSTKPHHRHGLHYIKMFPITSQYQEKFWTGKDPSFLLYQKIIEDNRKQIISECQAYLDAYADGKIPEYSVRIDAIIKKLFLSEE